MHSTYFSHYLTDTSQGICSQVFTSHITTYFWHFTCRHDWLLSNTTLLTFTVTIIHSIFQLVILCFLIQLWTVKPSLVLLLYFYLINLFPFRSPQRDISDLDQRKDPAGLDKDNPGLNIGLKIRLKTIDILTDCINYCSCIPDFLTVKPQTPTFGQWIIQYIFFLELFSNFQATYIQSLTRGNLVGMLDPICHSIFWSLHELNIIHY